MYRTQEGKMMCCFIRVNRDWSIVEIPPTSIPLTVLSFTAKKPTRSLHHYFISKLRWNSVFCQNESAWKRTMKLKV